MNTYIEIKRRNHNHVIKRIDVTGKSPQTVAHMYNHVRDQTARKYDVGIVDSDESLELNPFLNTNQTINDEQERR
jgi:glycerol-3-phosphate O-acyltransferase